MLVASGKEGKVRLHHTGISHRREECEGTICRRRLVYPIVIMQESCVLFSLTMFSMLTVVICHALIVIDSMIDVLHLSAIIDLSRSCVELSSSHYNLFIMFMIYFHD